MWDEEMIILLRHVIDDLDTVPKYSDDRLAQLILLSGQYVQNENAFLQTYNIDIVDLDITPDPTNEKAGTRDEQFIDLTILKAACLLSSSGLLKVAAENMSVREGPYSFDGRGKLTGRNLAAKTWCDAYKDAAWEYGLYQRLETGRAIIGPYRLAMKLGSGNSRGGCDRGSILQY
jgi:hypothetical protein